MTDIFVAPPEPPSLTTQLNDIFSCAICLSTCVDPCTATCGTHNFCIKHLQEWVRKNAKKEGGPKCPCCRVSIQKTPEDCKINIAIRDAITAIEISKASNTINSARPSRREKYTQFKKGDKLGFISFNSGSGTAFAPATGAAFPSFGHLPPPSAGDSTVVEGDAWGAKKKEESPKPTTRFSSAASTDTFFAPFAGGSTPAPASNVNQFASSPAASDSGVFHCLPRAGTFQGLDPGSCKTEEDKEETILLCINIDCERYPPDWDFEKDTKETYEGGQWQKCTICDGYFNDDGLGDILFIEEEPNNQRAGCDLCGKSKNIVQMKGTGQYICEAACDEVSSESD